MNNQSYGELAYWGIVDDDPEPPELVKHPPFEPTVDELKEIDPEAAEKGGTIEEMSREQRIQRTERIIKRRRKILEKYGGETNLLWNKVRKHNLSCQCAQCKATKEFLRKEREKREALRNAD